MKPWPLIVALSVIVALAAVMHRLAAEPEWTVQLGELSYRARAYIARQTSALSQRIYSRLPGDDAEWHPEDAVARARLPLLKTIPAVPTEQLTPQASPPAQRGFMRWDRSHGGDSSLHYSAYDQINRSNVALLRPVWTYRAAESAGSIQANPVYHRGRVFFPTSQHLVAVDATDGREVWTRSTGARFPARRGLLLYGESDAPQTALLFAAGTSLLALDSGTGRPSHLLGGGSARIGYPAKTAPAVFENLVIVASTKPAVHAFDIQTGNRVWTTDLIDGNQPGGPGGRPSIQQGGNPWGGLSIDGARGIVFVTTGNPSPPLVGIYRPGPNKHSNSVVAIDARTGRIDWAFQEIEHDIWDLDLPAPPILTSIMRDGQPVDVVAAVSKTGNTLLLDRVHGQPIFDYRLRRAPVSTLPGERTAPYQPDPLLPTPFGKPFFTRDDITRIGVRNTESVANALETRNFGFYHAFEEGVETVFFGLNGGASWAGAAADPFTGALYVAASHVPSMAAVIDDARKGSGDTMPSGDVRAHCGSCHNTPQTSLAGLGTRMSRSRVESIIRSGIGAMPPVSDISEEALSRTLDQIFDPDRTIATTGNGASTTPQYRRTEYRRLLDHEGYPGSQPPWGTLNKLDLNTGRLLWKVPLGEYPELTARGLAITGTENIGGPVITAGGLVFVAGTLDKKIRAFDSDTGEELWAYELPYIGSAAPMTYSVDGRQYLLVPATGPGG